MSAQKLFNIHILRVLKFIKKTIISSDLFEKMDLILSYLILMK